MDLRVSMWLRLGRAERVAEPPNFPLWRYSFGGSGGLGNDSLTSIFDTSDNANGDGGAFSP
jgi:hypothetical protein